MRTGDARFHLPARTFSPHFLGQSRRSPLPEVQVVHQLRHHRHHPPGSPYPPQRSGAPAGAASPLPARGTALQEGPPAQGRGYQPPAGQPRPGIRPAPPRHSAGSARGAIPPTAWLEAALCRSCCEGCWTGECSPKNENGRARVLEAALNRQLRPFLLCRWRGDLLMACKCLSREIFWSRGFFNLPGRHITRAEGLKQ